MERISCGKISEHNEFICCYFEYRGKSLSKWLIQTITHHPELQGLRRWSLATADAHGLYKQFGFTEITRPERWMEIFTPYQVLNKQKHEHKEADI